MAYKQNPTALAGAHGAEKKALRDVVTSNSKSPFGQRYLIRPRAQVGFLLENKAHLTRKELAFVQDLQAKLNRYPDATDRQTAWLDAIYKRVWCPV
jgi:hypothetical protein